MHCEIHKCMFSDTLTLPAFPNLRRTIIKYNIPHQFHALPTIGTTWCCHCGHMLPLGRKHRRICSECNITCHTNCSHLVPKLCGLSKDAATCLLLGWSHWDTPTYPTKQAQISQKPLPSPPLSPDSKQAQNFNQPAEFVFRDLHLYANQQTEGSSPGALGLIEAGLFSFCTILRDILSPLLKSFAILILAAFLSRLEFSPAGSISSVIHGLCEPTYQQLPSWIDFRKIGNVQSDTFGSLLDSDVGVPKLIGLVSRAEFTADKLVAAVYASELDSRDLLVVKLKEFAFAAMRTRNQLQTLVERIIGALAK